MSSFACSVRRATFAVSLAFLALQSAPAQTPAVAEAAPTTEVIVTGSRIKQPNLTSTSPIQVVGERDIELNGTTDMIESLLIFSRTGTAMRKSPELMATLLERAVAVVRAHPDAEGVTLETHYGDPAETAVVVDGKQIERAISNLLVNACQAVHCIGTNGKVVITLETHENSIVVNVIDNGPGVPEKIRESLFEPFVSEGKQKGTGLGLTLAYCIAVEHGGSVVLLSSRPGETIFQMSVARGLGPADAGNSEHHDKVVPDENVRT